MTAGQLLLALAAQVVVLLAIMAVYRSTLSLTGKKAPNSFDPTGKDLGGFSVRLCRTHANCIENLPVTGAIVGVAMVSGAANVIAPLACWFFVARLLQSTVHLISTSVLAVYFRFFFFLVQVGIWIYWLCQLFKIHS